MIHNFEHTKIKADLKHDHIPFYRYEEERVKCMYVYFLKIALSVTFLDF